MLAIPPGMDFATAAAFGLTYATSEHALVDRGALKAGETLLVLGAAGGVGLAAIEIGKILGARVIACASTDDKLAVCRAHGADETINYATEDLRERIKALTGGTGCRRRLRSGRRAVHRARAALDRLARPPARGRLRRRRDSEDSAEPDAAQGLLDRRRVLGRLGAPRAGAFRRGDGAARPLVRRRQAQAAHLGDLPARACGRCAHADGVAKGDRQSRSDGGVEDNHGHDAVRPRSSRSSRVRSPAAIARPAVLGDAAGGADAGGATPRPNTFFAGTATAFKPIGPLGMDGAWKIAPDTTAAYTVRMLVRRPADATKFNGIVVVEWLNVTANAEGAADFMQMQEELLRQGYAWVGVGAQAAGVNSPRSGLKDFDKARYGSLVHPGDAYSYDIFSQAADALRHPKSAGRARRSDDPEDDRHRPVAVGVPSRDLHQRDPSELASVRRLSRAQPRRERVRLHGRRARARRRERGAARRAHPRRHRRPGARSADRRRHGRAARAPDAPAAVRALSPLGDRRRRARGNTALGRRGAAAARHGTRPARIR